MEALAPFHPRLVHFAIALSLVGALFIALGVLLPRSKTREGQNDFLKRYGRVTLSLGWLGILAAIASGLLDQSRAPDTPSITATINRHITTGIALLVAVGLALYWPIRDKSLWNRRGRLVGYLVLLAVIAALVALEGWLGGKLVYQYGVGVR